MEGGVEGVGSRGLRVEGKGLSGRVGDRYRALRRSPTVGCGESSFGRWTTSTTSSDPEHRHRPLAVAESRSSSVSSTRPPYEQKYEVAVKLGILSRGRGGCEVRSVEGGVRKEVLQ